MQVRRSKWKDIYYLKNRKSIKVFNVSVTGTLTPTASEYEGQVMKPL
jgi:hypothetical protein